MKRNEYLQRAQTYLHTLCTVKPHRRVGSPGNRAATDFFASVAEPWGYDIDTAAFKCLDHTTGKCLLTCGKKSFEVFISPYSPGCKVTAKLVTVSTLEELAECSCRGGILLMKGPICTEQLMPKNFVFYNPDHHKRIYALLEQKRPAAIITATEKRPELVGAIYPFPLIEDGDFDIPSVYCRETIGEEIAERTGETLAFTIEAKRIPAKACNVILRKNREAGRKITVCAHIDARESTPGASDNASGTVVLLLLAEMLADYTGPLGLEIAAFNGEDHYSAGGQMDYLRRYGADLDRIQVGVNIDDVGYVRGKAAYSLHGCSAAIKRKVQAAFSEYSGLMEGDIWYQGDHMIFAQQGRPAIALTAEKAAELMRTVTHTPKDTPELINCGKLVEVAEALRDLIAQW